MNAVVVSFQSTHFDFYHKNTKKTRKPETKQRCNSKNGRKIQLNLAQCDST